MGSRTRSLRRLLPYAILVAVGAASGLPAAASGAATVAPASSAVGRPDGEARAALVLGRSSGPVRAAGSLTRGSVARAEAPRGSLAPAIVPASIPVPAAPVGVESKVGPSSPAATGSDRSYRGRNHVWIPALGLSRSVSFFACSRNTALDHVVYRWGCAGANNVYLMGHASSVMKPLHDAYVSGRLRKGMKAVYADGDGRVRTYAVTYWRVVRPDGDIGWAFASQARPSMTLQTCVGADSAYRLVVRLVAVD